MGQRARVAARTPGRRLGKGPWGERTKLKGRAVGRGEEGMYFLLNFSFFFATFWVLPSTVSRKQILRYLNKTLSFNFSDVLICLHTCNTTPGRAGGQGGRTRAPSALLTYKEIVWGPLTLFLITALV